MAAVVAALAAEQVAQAAEVAGAAAVLLAMLAAALVAVVAVVAVIAPIPLAAPGVALVVGALRVDQPLELAAVQEDAAAVASLVDLEAAALVRAHRALALGTNEFGHVSQSSGVTQRPAGGARSGAWSPGRRCRPG